MPGDDTIFPSLNTYLPLPPFSPPPLISRSLPLFLAHSLYLTFFALSRTSPLSLSFRCALPTSSCPEPLESATRTIAVAAAVQNFPSSVFSTFVQSGVGRGAAGEAGGTVRAGGRGQRLGVARPVKQG